MNEELEQAVATLIDRLLTTQEYKAYLKYKERVSGDEECLNKIRRFRELSYELQNCSDERRMSEAARIEAECDALCGDFRVLDFMQAEIDFIRLYQSVISRIIEEIDIEE